MKDKPKYYDQPEPKPFPCEIIDAEGKRRITALNIGNCAIALFRHRPDMDYLAVEHEEKWVYIFDKHPLIYWMGGIALSREGQHMLRLMERNNGRFADRYNFSPDVVIEDRPSQAEIDVYIEHQIGGAFDDPHADLNRALRQDFDGQD